MTINRHKKEEGYSLLEIIIYIAILVAMVYVIISLVVSIVQAKDRLNSARALATSAATALDRMTREIRGAKDVNTGASTLGTSPGVLNLDSTASGGAPETVEFRVVAGVLRIKINGVDQGPLTASSTTVTGLTFRRNASSTAEAIKIEMTLQSGTTTSIKTKNFYGSALIR